jgi:hypothetical protein
MLGLMDRNYILGEIRRTAQENGGKPLGVARFEAETGIRPRTWQAFWPRWGDALAELGLEPNALQGRFDDDVLLAHLVAETRRLGHVPTSRELRVRHVTDLSFPDARVFERWRRPEMMDALTAYCGRTAGTSDVLPIVAARSEALASTRSPLARPPTSPADGAVYMAKMGRHYKIGRSNSAGRREYELALQLPERAVTVHIIRTDDPVGIEAYWHRRFADRRANGEWFALTAEDVTAFKRRKFM